MRFVFNSFCFNVKKALKSHLNIFHYFIFALLLISFIIPFLAGFFVGDTKKEELSNYIADVVKNNTNEKRIMSVSVTPTRDSGVLPFSDEKEFYALYGIFKQESITYASGYNVNKEIKITIPALNNNVNYSIFYNAKDSTVDYNGHYKHWYYPIEYMFPAVRLYDISKYMIYLTQSQADTLLSNQGKIKNNNRYKEEDYKSLIKQVLVVNINDSNFECVIGNIIYEQNYYYNGLKEVLNDFFACAYYCPGDLIRSSLYFFNNYSYQNSYFMNYINQTYSNKLYDVNVVQNNIVNEFDFKTVTNFYYGDFRGNVVLYIILIVIAITLLSASIFIIFIKCRNFSIKFLLLSCLSVFTPYLIFFIISVLSHSILFFSNKAITLYVYLIIYYIVGHLMIYIAGKIYRHHLKKRANICRR